MMPRGTVHLRCCEQPHRGQVKIFTHPIPPFSNFAPTGDIVSGDCYGVTYERQNDINRGIEDEVHDLVWYCRVKRQYTTPSYFYGPTRAESIAGSIPAPFARTVSPNGSAAPPFASGRSINCTVGDGFQDRPLPLGLGSYNVRPLDNPKPDEWSYENVSAAEIDGVENVVFRANDDETGIPEIVIVNGEAGVNYGFRWGAWEKIGTNIWRRVIESWWDYYDEESGQLDGSVSSLDFGWEKVTATNEEGKTAAEVVAAAIASLASGITVGLGTRSGWLSILERVFNGMDLDYRDYYTSSSAFVFNSFSVYVGFDPVIQIQEIPFVNDALPTNGDQPFGVAIIEGRNFTQFRFDTDSAPRLFNPNLESTEGCPRKLDVTQNYLAIAQAPFAINHPALFPAVEIRVSDYRALTGGVFKLENLVGETPTLLSSTADATASGTVTRCLFDAGELASVALPSAQTILSKQVVEGTGGARLWDYDGFLEFDDKTCGGVTYVLELIGNAAFAQHIPRSDGLPFVTDSLAKKAMDYGDAYFISTGQTFEPYEADAFTPNADL
jgi:hypothetical protein